MLSWSFTADIEFNHIYEADFLCKLHLSFHIPYNITINYFMGIVIVFEDNITNL